MRPTVVAFAGLPVAVVVVVTVVVIVAVAVIVWVKISSSVSVCSTVVVSVVACAGIAIAVVIAVIAAGGGKLCSEVVECLHDLLDFRSNLLLRGVCLLVVFLGCHVGEMLVDDVLVGDFCLCC